MPTVQLEDQTLYYQTIGEGSPVLLMHGWVGVSGEMMDVAERVAALGRRVIVVDRPGYGQSVPPFRTYPPDFYHRDARVMGQFLSALQLEKVDIMGFSDGGEVALLMPILFPHLCRSSISWGATGSFPVEFCESQRAALPHTWITDYHRSLHPGQDIDKWPEQWVEAFCAMCAAGGDVSLSQADTITCPVLLILGDRDRLNPAEYAQKFVDRVPNHLAQLIGFPNIGHHVFAETPEGFMAAVIAFWKKYGLS